MKEKIYETPLSVEIGIVVEQAVLTASGSEYPAFSDEQNLGW